MSLWLRPDNTFRIIVSLSIKIVYCISATTCLHKSFVSKIFSSSFIVCFLPPPSALITRGATLTLKPGLRSLSSNARCLYFFLFLNSFFDVIFLWARYIAYPDILLLLFFKYQLWSSRCCRLSQIKLKSPHQLFWRIFQIMSL